MPSTTMTCRRPSCTATLRSRYGRYIGHIPSSPPERRWFYVWYEKVYAKRDGRWVYLSHRTVDGAHYAADRSALDLD